MVNWLVLQAKPIIFEIFNFQTRLSNINSLMEIMKDSLEIMTKFYEKSKFKSVPR